MLTEALVSIFEEAERRAPDDPAYRELLRHITTHERALLTFVIREQDGRSDASLEAVLALLKNPPALFPRTPHEG